MTSSLMPPDSDKALHLKLLELLDDAMSQYRDVNQLILPEKIKVKARAALNHCMEKYIALPNREMLSALKDAPASGLVYIAECKKHFLMFSDFYVALETLIVTHFLGYEHHDGNAYLKAALDKIPDTKRYQLPVKKIALPPRSGSESVSPCSPRSPRSPRSENQDKMPVSPRKRGLSHVILPSFFKKGTKQEDETLISPRERRYSDF